MGKKNTIFVGAFNTKHYSNVIGGQLFACNSLIDSGLKDKIAFTLIDTTQKSIPPPNIFTRSISAFLRISWLLYYLCTRKFDSCLIFCADGLSFIEKGIMIVLSKKFSIKTVLYPRSGFSVNDVKSPFFKKFYKIVLNHTDCLLVQGQTWKEFYKEINPYVNIKVQHNWIDDSKYKKIEFKNDNKLQILFLGWVTKQKGIFDLIDVYEKLVKVSKFDLKLIIAGEGDSSDEVRRLLIAKDLTHSVKMCGWISGGEKIKLLCESDIYVHPSYYEGYPNALIEAMCTGLCAVTSTAGSIPDVIKNNINGLLFNAGDTKHFYECLSRVIQDNDLRQRLSEQGYLTSKENNSLNSAIKKIGDIL